MRANREIARLALQDYEREEAEQKRFLARSVRLYAEGVRERAITNRCTIYEQIFREMSADRFHIESPNKVRQILERSEL